MNFTICVSVAACYAILSPKSTCKSFYPNLDDGIKVITLMNKTHRVAFPIQEKLNNSNLMLVADMSRSDVYWFLVLIKFNATHVICGKVNPQIRHSLLPLTALPLLVFISLLLVLLLIKRQLTNKN
jgi:hypothetical protein